MELTHFASKAQVAALFRVFQPLQSTGLNAALPSWLETMYIYALSSHDLQQLREQWRQRNSK